MSTTSEHNRRKVWKWLYRLYERHPFLRVTFRVVDGTQRFVLTAGDWRRELVSESDLSMVTDGRSAVIASFSSGFLKTDEVLSALEQHCGALPFTRLGSTDELYGKLLKLLCLYARATGCTVSSTRFGAWVAGPLTLATNGTLAATGQTVDLTAPPFLLLSDDDQVAALASLAAGGTIDTLPAVATAVLDGGSLHARFAPDSDDDVLLVREERALQVWRPASSKEPISPGLKPGFATFWGKSGSAWLITSAGQARQWPGTADSRILETGLHPAEEYPGPRPILGGDQYVLAAAVNGQRIRFLRRKGELDEKALLEQLAGIDSASPNGVPLTGTALAYESGRWLVASDLGFRMRLFGLHNKAVHETEDGQIDGHPERCAVHPLDTLAAQLSRNVCFFDPASGRLLYTVALGPGPKPDGVFHPNRPFFLILRGGELLALRLDTLQLRLLVALGSTRWPEHEHSALAISESGKKVVAARDKTWMFDWTTLEALFDRGQDVATAPITMRARD
jgi:hypothetical protein